MTIRPARQLHIVNVVCAGTMVTRALKDAGRIALRPLADVLCGRYARDGFQCVTTHGVEPSVTSHVFGTGAFICCGANSEWDNTLTAWRIQRLVRTQLGIPVWIADYGPRNAVAATATGYGIDLEKFRDQHEINGCCEYEPDLYPGLQYFPNFPAKRPCVIIHRSGTINVVGTSSLAAATATLHELRIERYRISDTAAAAGGGGGESKSSKGPAVMSNE